MKRQKKSRLRTTENRQPQKTMTYNVTAGYAHQNFDEINQRASMDAEGIVIVKDNKSFVLIDRQELEALLETSELLRIPNLLNNIAQAREDYQNGETVTMEDII